MKMPKPPDSPRFVTLVSAAGVFLLLLAGTYMLFHNERSYRQTKTEQVDAQAAILASTVAAALDFDDRKAAQEYIGALAADPEIREAAIYDARGQLFAGYSREGLQPLPASVGAARRTEAGNHIAVTLPVRQGTAAVGTVYLQTIIEPLSRRLERYGAIGLVYVMAILSFFVLTRIQRTLARANAALEAQRAELARANEALRTQIEEREKVEMALRQSQKMDAIGQLTGGIAHDFNNLLQVIIGNLEMLQRRDLPLGDDARRMLTAAARGADRAATLTSRLLAFARRQPLDPKPFDVSKLVTNMSELLRRVLGERIRVETVLAAGTWRVNADVNQLENALVNLVVNARDAMPQGGKLTIETSNAFLDEAYAAANEASPGQYVLIAVSDTGLGMTRDVQDKAFEPFFTTKGVGKGTGLGLSQVYGFIRQSGGHAKIYSEPGQGTTIKLYLPRVQDDAEAAAAPTVSPRRKRATDRPILVVEDDDDVRSHVVQGLTEFGYRVREAADGASALRALAESPPVCLLFTDIGLPGGMNGRELADEVQRRIPGLPVLFTTAYARNAVVHHGRLDAGVELITKPFTLPDLAQRIERVLATAGVEPGGALDAEAAN
jgi:signal transduction histidine kinase/ActR/RegA family two-component response regulator